MAKEYEPICIDEAHFRRDADKRHCWSTIGTTPIVYVNGSIQNVNVYGAYTLHGKFHYKFVERQISETTIAFIEQLRKKYKKILIIMDNAGWHTSKKVRAYVEDHAGDVVLVRLPAYSPDLNPVEECWRQTRNTVTANTPFESTNDLKKSLRSSWNKQLFRHKIINYLCP